MSYQPAQPGVNTYYLRASSNTAPLFQFDVNIVENDSSTEVQKDAAFQALVTAINASTSWNVDYAQKSNVDTQQVTP